MSRSRSSRLASALAAAWLLLGSSPRPALAQHPVPDPDFWLANGNVDAMARSGNTLYMGGEFDYLGPPTGASVLTDPATGARDTRWPRVHGIVFSIVPDGAGGWYVMGGFDAVAGLPRTNLARIRADLSVDPWAPVLSASAEPYFALVVHGGVLYVGGAFTTINGQSRQHLAAFDVATGSLLPWAPQADGGVNVLAFGQGSIIAGGEFANVGGIARAHLAALDPQTGAVAAWNPGANSVVNALAVDGSTLYVGGSFSSVGGQARTAAAALDLASGQASAWNPNPDGGVRSLAVSGGTVYMAGDFTHVGGVARAGVASVGAVTGTVTAWAPSMTGGYDCQQPNVWSLVPVGGMLYLGGDFVAFMGQPRRSAAAIDLAGGGLTSWDPGIGGSVIAMAAQGSGVCVGGQFGSAGGVTRRGLAAVDLSGGTPTGWNPNLAIVGACHPEVYAIAAHAGRVWVGGSFNSIGGQSWTSIAAIDSATGVPCPFAGLSANSPVGRMALKGDTLFVSGAFTAIHGVPRAALAAIDTRTGAVTGFDAHLTSSFSGGPDVTSMCVRNDTLYVGATASDSVAHQPIRAPLGLFALDAGSGLALPWSLQCTAFQGEVDAMSVHDGQLFVSGGFSFHGLDGNLRNNLAAIRTADGVPAQWRPTSSGVTTLATQPPTFAIQREAVYLAGSFSSLSGQPRYGFGAVDVQTGAVTGWAPGPRLLEWPLRIAVADSSFVYATQPYVDDSSPWPLSLSPVRFATTLDTLPPTVTAESPAAGGPAFIGATQTLRWSAVDDRSVQSVDVFLSRGGAAGPWEPVALGMTGRASDDWVVTGPPASQAVLRVDARDGDGNIGSATTGAFTIADWPTAALVSRFDLDDRPDGITIRWASPDPAAGARLAPQRSEGEAGAWSDVRGAAARDGDGWTLVDADVNAGGTYRYRLAGVLADGTRVTEPPRSVTHGAVPAFALGEPTPNPASATCAITYAMPRAARVTLSLLDVQGRVIRTLERAEQAAGRHVVSLGTQDLTPGLYFVRLEAPDARRQRRFVVLR